MKKIIIFIGILLASISSLKAEDTNLTVTEEVRSEGTLWTPVTSRSRMPSSAWKKKTIKKKKTQNKKKKTIRLTHTSLQTLYLYYV